MWLIFYPLYKLKKEKVENVGAYYECRLSAGTIFKYNKKRIYDMACKGVCNMSIHASLVAPPPEPIPQQPVIVLQQQVVVKAPHNNQQPQIIHNQQRVLVQATQQQYQM
jgi:hypothetical protein